jgi:transcriptional regulator with XRE-family HTH domain
MFVDIGGIEFGARLKKMRSDAGLSVRELGQRAKISFSAISGLENARRPAGKRTLERLGSFFGLRGDGLETFVHQGLAASGRDKLLDYAKAYPAPVYNLLPRILAQLGISPASIRQISVDLRGPSQPDLLLQLGDGSNVEIDIKVRRRR